MWQTAGIVALIVLALAAWFSWYNFFRVVPQPEMTADERFMYGSVGAEDSVGIPYWIMVVLPRVFPDKLPGPNGLQSMGINWETGKELPIGFTKKTIGFDRVANNCAACHVARYRVRPWSNPRFVPTGPNHTFNLEAFFRFLIDCAEDPRFNADTLMAEINLDADLTWTQKQIYRYVLIPITRKRLIERRARFQWIYFTQPRPYWPDWGNGRDDAMNLTKYFLTTSPVDQTLGPTDMPSIWNIGKYRNQPRTRPTAPSYNCEPGTLTRLNFAGDSCDANSVIIDSALGLINAAPKSNADFLAEKDWLYQYLSSYQPPKFRDAFPDVKIDDAAVQAGRKLFAANCAACHWSSGMDIPAPAEYRTGSVVPLQEIGTDDQRIKSWNKDAAIRSNDAVKAFGIERHGLVEANPYGYVAQFLDGIWLRAPYLHNGSVPTLRDLLEPPEKRPPAFYRGYDVYDPQRGGFISTQEQADRLGAAWGYVPGALWDDVRQHATSYDVHWRSNGNQGHLFGTQLTPAEKDQLVAYLLTL
jgi:mono/diheme cytochrome c family protein